MGHLAVSLTVASHIGPCRVDELDLVLIEACEVPQVLVLAFVREWVDALVAVVEVCEQNVGPCFSSSAP